MTELLALVALGLLTAVHRDELLLAASATHSLLIQAHALLPFTIGTLSCRGVPIRMEFRLVAAVFIHT
jgi:hypothetical protein